ncbi:DUF2752 domain-containing protein [Streptacidiphilus rugosus]|uniref:DUF2752 domain-containing protein n=1 Tax=Streptacidiphilus rugosus TaxID=405783 RepID=UPI00056340A0|nr:DUF2752 domain-containing protein [Streptacidiphilus rugosus]
MTAAAPAPAHASPSPADGPRGSRARGLVASLGLFGATAAATAYVGAVDPNRPGHYPVCPFLRLTGWWCPGCGGLRAVHALTRGDLTGALHDNALGVLLCATAVGVWAFWTTRVAAGRPRPTIRLGRPWIFLLLAVVLVFTVLRNLPTGAFLAP